MLRCRVMARSDFMKKTHPEIMAGATFGFGDHHVFDKTCCSNLFDDLFLIIDAREGEL